MNFFFMNSSFSKGILKFKLLFICTSTKNHTIKSIRRHYEICNTVTIFLKNGFLQVFDDDFWIVVCV